MKHLTEMANLWPEDTGLSMGIIRISSKEGKHGARIKYYRTKANKNSPSASISISDKPEVKEDSIGLTPVEIRRLFKFVTLNKRILLLYWEQGEILRTKDVIDNIIKI